MCGHMLCVCVCVYTYHEKVTSDLFEMTVSLSPYLRKAYQMKKEKEKALTDYHVPLRVKETFF